MASAIPHPYPGKKFHPSQIITKMSRLEKSVTLNDSLKVQMVTEDIIQKAKAMALECSILDPKGTDKEPSPIGGRSSHILRSKEKKFPDE
ncbi:hypothetical protein QJS04_geneDACA014281 [Acorus gramineus]|uniref:Uncharacterized protein n=1 Tax=Acorus gramineus TaxID=55184 RepID=A0AAV9BYD8_ACOGR|nr:hypothetical protein QJS04_geneDACA014281 [Acorus gramineus]